MANRNPDRRDDTGVDADPGSAPRIPCWVIVAGISIGILVLLLAVALVTGRGGPASHAPGRHKPSGGPDGQPAPSGATENQAPPKGGHG